MKSLWAGVRFLIVTLASWSAVHAQTNSDNPTAGLDLGLPLAPDITVVEAVYGGRESYVDVTKEVSELLGKPDSFEPTGVALGVKDPVHGQANYLIIVFDLDGHRYVFTRQNNGDKVNARFLKAEAKLAKESGPPKIGPAPILADRPQANSDNPTAGLALGPPPDVDVTVVEAVYGGLKQYLDVTKQVTELLGKPDSFDPTGATLGIEEPNQGKVNYLIIVFDLYGNRHVFARENNGDPVNAKALEAEAKLDEAAAPSK